MPYPYTTAGGGITSVAWGDITGSLGAQTDLQSALNSKLEDVQWGDITGTLSSQSDLQAALDAKADAPSSTLDATDNTFWSGGVGGFPYSWSGTEWVPTNYDDDDPIVRYIDRTGTWNDGYRPTSARIILNSGSPSEFTGSLSGSMQVIIKDGFGSTIGSQSFTFTSWSEDIEVNITSLSYSGSGSGTHIDRLEVWSSLRNAAPIIKLIEFNE